MPASSVVVARNRLGNATKSCDPKAVRVARQDLGAAHVQAAIERVAAEFPPLRPEQRDRLALLLHGGASA